MKTQPATRFFHWLGMRMTDAQKLSFHKFKMENTALVIGWKTRYPMFRNVPPIYFNEKTKRWYWSEVPDDQIDKYMTICKAMFKAKQME